MSPLCCSALVIVLVVYYEQLLPMSMPKNGICVINLLRQIDAERTPAGPQRHTPSPSSHGTVEYLDCSSFTNSQQSSISFQ